MIAQHDPALAHLMDIGAVALLIGSLTSNLPDVAAALSIVWMAIRIWETKSIQTLLGRRKWNKHEDDQGNRSS